MIAQTLTWDTGSPPSIGDFLKVKDPTTGEMEVGTPAGGALVRGSGLLQGHTSTGSDATTAPDLTITFTLVPFDGVAWSLTVYGNVYGFTWSASDPANGTTWIDLAPISTVYDAATAFAAAINNMLLGTITASNLSEVVTVTNSTTGVTSFLGISIGDGSATSTGGGTGVDAVAPSGGISEVVIIAQSGTKTIKPIRAEFHDSSGVAVGVQFALKVGASYYPIGNDLGASVTVGRIEPVAFYAEWISGRASAALVALMTGATPIGGTLTCWAVAEQI